MHMTADGDDAHRRKRQGLNVTMVSAGMIYPEDDYTRPEYPAEKAQREKDLGYEGTFFELSHSGYLPYESSTAPMFPDLNHDLLAGLIDAYHARGMKFVAMFVTTVDSCEYVIQRHPDWIQKNPDGSAGICPCFVSPFAEYLLTQVREVLQRYPVDGIYFDQLPTGCYCSYCREQFLQRFGYPLPTPAELARQAPGFSEEQQELGGTPSVPKAKAHPQLGAFIQQNTRAFLTKVKSIRDQCRPEAAFLCAKIWGPDGAEFRHLVDGLLPEWRYYRAGGLHNITLNRLMTSAYAGGLGVWDPPAYDVRLNRRARPACEAVLQTAEAVANGCCSVLVRSFGAYEHDRVNRRQVAAALRELAEVRTRRRQAAPLPYCALVHSKASRAGTVRHAVETIAGVKSMGAHRAGPVASEHELGLEGIHSLLIESHIPYHVLTEENLIAGALNDFGVVVLAETDALDPAAVEAVRRFADCGGGVVALGRTVGDRNEALCDILGVQPVGLRGLGDETPDLRYEGQVPLSYRWGEPFNPDIS